MKEKRATAALDMKAIPKAMVAVEPPRPAKGPTANNAWIANQVCRTNSKAAATPVAAKAKATGRITAVVAEMKAAADIQIKRETARTKAEQEPAPAE